MRRSLSLGSHPPTAAIGIVLDMVPIAYPDQKQTSLWGNESRVVWSRTGHIGIAAALRRVDVGDRCGGATLTGLPGISRHNEKQFDSPRSALRMSLVDAIVKLNGGCGGEVRLEVSNRNPRCQGAPCPPWFNPIITPRMGNSDMESWRHEYLLLNGIRNNCCKLVN